MPEISRTTVYRVLETLVRVGIERKVRHPGAAARYEVETHRHHHLVRLNRSYRPRCRLSQLILHRKAWNGGPSYCLQAEKLKRTGLQRVAKWWRSVGKLCTGRPSAVRRVTFLFCADAEHAAGATGSRRRRGWRRSSSSNSSGAQSETYGGVEIVLKRDKEPMAVAFLKEGILVAGDPVGVCGVIAWQGQPARLAPGLRQKAAELSAGRDVWFVSTVPVAEAAAQVPSPQMKSVLQGETLKSVEQVSGGLRFLVGLARSRQPAAASFTEDLKVTGRTMNLSVSIPEAEVEKMILATRKAAPKAAEPAKPAETGITVYSSPSDMGVVKIPPPKN